MVHIGKLSWEIDMEVNDGVYRHFPQDVEKDSAGMKIHEKPGAHLIIKKLEGRVGGTDGILKTQ